MLPVSRIANNKLNLGQKVHMSLKDSSAICGTVACSIYILNSKSFYERD